MQDENPKRTRELIESCIWKTDEFGNADKTLLKIDSEVATDNDKDEFLTILNTGSAPSSMRSKYAENFRYFQKKIDQFLHGYPSCFSYLPARILNNCILLPIEADNQNTALRIFSTLNDRGLPLSDADIFKAQFYKYYSDKGQKEYFIETWKELEEICDKVDSIDISNKKSIKGKFYVEKINTIYSKGNVYYEITLSKASDYNNKFERLTFYSKEYIPDNNSINITSVDDFVELNVGMVRIKVIVSYKIAIRICELKNIFKNLGENRNFGENYKEYRNLMNYLTENEYTIKQIVCSSENDFNSAIDYIKNGAENHYISLMLIKIKEIIKNNKSGCNILRYLTSKMVNTVIRDQIGTEPHRYLSDLYIHKKSGMFEAMPFSMSLHNHNPQFYDLIKAIDVENKDDELLYSYIRNNTESNDELYTPIDEIGYFDNIPRLVEKYNNKILSRLSNTDSILVLDDNFLYIKEYEKNLLQL